MELLNLSHSHLLLLAIFHWLCYSYGVCLSLSFIVVGFLALSLPVLWSRCMPLTVSYACFFLFSLSLSVQLSWCMFLSVFHSSCLSLSVSPVILSCCMALTVSYVCWLSLIVSKELLHVYNFLPYLMAFSNNCHCSLELLNVLTSTDSVLRCLSQCHGTAECLSLTLPVPWSHRMSMTVSNGCWLSLIISPCPMELLNVSHCDLLLLAFYQLHETGRDSKRQPATMRNSERHAATPWNWNSQCDSDSNNRRLWETCSNSERKPANIGDT